MQLLLAAPFVIAIALLGGLTSALPMFHGSDELIYHYPTIVRFAGQLPFPDLSSYPAAQTPLFHVLMAYLGKVVGFELWRLRLVEAVISYVLVLAVLRLLTVRLGMGRLQAVALSLLFALSPYVFAPSFRLMTDNLALLFSVLAIDRLERFRESGALLPFLVACACSGAAVLTRQSAGFLFAMAGAYALCARGLPARTRTIALGAVGLAAVPAGLLFLSWHGLTPPGSDTSSCGLCTSTGGSGASGLRLSTAELTLAVVALYGSILFAPAFPWRDRALLRELMPGAVGGALICAVVLVLFPARPHVGAGTQTTAGFVWNAAGHAPRVFGTSLLLWALVPLSGPLLRWRLAVAPRRWLLVVLLGSFLLGTLVIRLSWQKYVDPFVLLALLISARPTELESPWRLAGAAVLAVGFVAYALSFV